MEKNNLLKITKETQSLSPQTKEKISRRVDTMDAEQVGKLTAIIEKGDDRLQNVDKKYAKMERPLKQQYLKEIETFRHTGTRIAIDTIEKKDESNKEKKLAKLLATIGPDEKGKVSAKRKSPRIIYILPVLVILAAAAYYFLVYVKTP